MVPFKKRVLLYLLIGLSIVVVLSGAILFISQRPSTAKQPKSSDVVLPTIQNGELVLPTITSTADTNLNKMVIESRLSVVSANLAAIYENNKLTGIRIVGEMQNAGSSIVSQISPVVRLLDENGNVISQKIAQPSSGYKFYDLLPSEKTLYDVTVSDPPTSQRLEIMFNVSSSTESASFEPLKIASRSLEIKTTNMNSTGDSSESGQTVDYFVVSGKVLNPYETPVTEIAVYAWAKDEMGKVFALGHMDFKNDLINTGGETEFRIMMTPVRLDQKYVTYEVAAWGKKYWLSF